MTKIEDKRPVRSSLDLRLGITGARRLRADQLDRIRTQLHDVLALTKQEMERLSEEAAVAESYARTADGRVQLRLRMISPLARGADRLAARTALDLGYALCVPMPFGQAEYEKDFKGREDPEEALLTPEEDLAEFREQLASASTRFALDGDRDRKAAPDRDGLAGLAYEAVGRFVVRHCDVLIAVWDGRQSNGRGGTADIVHYAATVGVPVWWIHAVDEKTGPAWLAGIQDLRDPALPSEHPEESLRAHLQRLIPPPPRVHPHDHGWIGPLGALFRKKNVSLAPAYFAEKPLPSRARWKTYSKVMTWASQVDPPWTPACRPDEPMARYWFDLFEPADARAGELAARYRSTYVLVIILATLALIFGAVALAFADKDYERLSLAMALLELLTLVLIVVLVADSFRSEWHERSIEYRLLAELFRTQRTLALLGWALSIGNVQLLADTERWSWVAWLFASAQRAAPLAEREFADNEADRTILQAFIEEQLIYHRRRERMARNAALKLEKIGGWVFAVVLLCVFSKVLTEG
ncbi:MAG: hypothetical protein WCA20_17955, partial [Candidatus Sulfotelmatobacter sp.]